MSTLVEHLAVMELYKAIGNDQCFDMESYLLGKAHFRELIELQNQEAMQSAREALEMEWRRIHPDRAEEMISAWRRDRVRAAQSASGDAA